MKKKFSRILGVGLTFVLLASLMAFATPVSAGTVSWSAFSPVPSSTSQVLEQGDVVDIGVSGDGDTIYAVGGAKLVYKSTNRGLTWSTIATTDNSDADLVAVAPDNDDIVAYVGTASDNLTVYVSVNGGTTWSNLGVPQEGTDAICTVISDMAISPEKGGKYYIAIAGEESAGANVWYYDVYAASAYWHETNDKNGFNVTTAATAETADAAAAVAFSPNFASDQVMLALLQDTSDSEITLEVYSYNHSKWNVSAGFDGYGVTITDAAGITAITSGSITLDPEYLFSDDSMRLAFIGLNVVGTPAESGIYRADDVAVKAIREGASYMIHSVAYNGSVLIGGRYDSNVCYYSTDPTATTPTFTSTRSMKRPGMLDGTGSVYEKVVLAWAGDDIVAGTSGDSSAFAVSTNDGKSFNDISLIDTESTVTGNMTDVVVSSDGSVTYMLTHDTHGTSLWRYASDWQRVLAIETLTDFIVRVAPDDPDVVYVADKASTAIYYSADGGTERWQTRTSKYSVADLAIEGDGDVAYVAASGTNKVSKSSNSGFTWGTYKSTGLTGDVNMIVSLAEDKLLVGGASGYVAYSTDGNSSWTKIGKQVGSSSNAVSAIASGLADDGYIYAGLNVIDKGIYRWQLGVSSSWKTLYSDTDNFTTYGIALEEGVLYVSTVDGVANTSKTFRTLNPTHSVAPSWSYMTNAASFDTAPQGIKVGGGKLWAINSEADALYSYTDTLATAGPTLSGPKTGLSVRVNPVAGYAMDITFSWEKPSDNVVRYQLRFYDSDSNHVNSVTVASTSSSPAQVVGKDISAAAFTFMPGETYTWKVRVASDGPVYSPYSEARTFTVTEVEAAAPVITVEPSPPAPAPDITVQPPEVTVTVETPPATVAPAAPAIPAYLLWTIIVIGAVLIIALIVLIVRTRRVV